MGEGNSIKVKPAELRRPIQQISKVSVNPFIRNLSCSSGWVKIALQTTFATIIVSSFMLIVSMSMNISSRTGNSTDSNIGSCEIQYCKVVCSQVTFYGSYEDEIILTVEEANKQCNQLFLTFDQPSFEEYTMQANWLSKMKTEIFALSLEGGNLKYFAKDAFVSEIGKNLKILGLHSLTISVLSPTILHGLLSLELLTLSNCVISKIEENALGEVSKTVTRLSMTRSGSWDPLNVTGATHDVLKLTQINLSSNNFSSIIDNHTFSSLLYCESLNLNSNRITTIGVGAFDNMQNIQIIYLFNNHLTTIPSGLFDKILNLNPKLNLDLLGNLWLCNCSSNALLLLITEGVLHHDPICFSPRIYSGITFSNFLQYCSINSQIEMTINDTHVDQTLEVDNSNILFTSNTCRPETWSIMTTNVSLISPLRNYQCLSNLTKMSSIMKIRDLNNVNLDTNDQWITPKFFIRNNIISILEISTNLINSTYGLVWYRTTCSNEVYCINVLPKYLRMHNIDSTARYVFCPLSLTTGMIDYEHCIVYSFIINESITLVTRTLKDVWHYVFTAIGFLAFGALVIYTIIWLKPRLLRGSKRLVLIKHKSIDALVLPPESSFQNIKGTKSTKIIHEQFTHTKKTLMVIGNRSLSSTEAMTRNSTRSSKSTAPSYISALQPTDEQMLEWRSQNFDNSAAVVSMNSDVSFFTKVYNSNLPFFSNAKNKEIYESSK